MNYHSFGLKDAKEIQGVAKNTRPLLKGDRQVDPFKETPAQAEAVSKQPGMRCAGTIFPGCPYGMKSAPSATSPSSAGVSRTSTDVSGEQRGVAD